jgi:hypothetical protein
VCGTNPGFNPTKQSIPSLCGRRNSPLDWGWLTAMTGFYAERVTVGHRE